ncbi:MAG: SRPBCC domain-containing protein [Saprospiraceae bacterium]|uniref:SRPBCC domain-containing protein n=1 Tax=Candidatus Opimibacter skivensis TaxID=2982028 RepID=A0A9D7STP3_9BACT|nr:SRPBCC domain-containing protein [Candidatus Opimibacter skivensis]
MKTIKQTLNFSIPPEKLYDMLMSSKTMSAIHGGKTTMNKRVNGKFTVFDGYCHGYNIELDPGKKIVQAWHFNEEGWPEDHFSKCTFLLQPFAKGTKLTFTQTDVPASTYDSLSKGWKDYYWEPIQLAIGN